MNLDLDIPEDAFSKRHLETETDVPAYEDLDGVHAAETLTQIGGDQTGSPNFTTFQEPDDAGVETEGEEEPHPLRMILERARE